MRKHDKCSAQDNKAHVVTYSCPIQQVRRATTDQSVYHISYTMFDQ